MVIVGRRSIEATHSGYEVFKDRLCKEEICIEGNANVKNTKYGSYFRCEKEYRLRTLNWWMFSKLDEHLDSVYIPYYNRLVNEVNKFKPDSTFRLKKQNNHSIVFIDPKGAAHTDYQYKANGFRRIFIGNGKKVFSQDGWKIRVYLYFFTEDRNKISNEYREYWIDNTPRGQVLSEIANDMSAQ